MEQTSTIHAMRDLLVPFYVKHDGWFVVIQPVTAAFYCKMDSTQFPFDSHTCYFTLTSWMHSDEYLKLTNAEGLKIFSKHVFTPKILKPLIKLKLD